MKGVRWVWVAFWMYYSYWRAGSEAEGKGAFPARCPWYPGELRRAGHLLTGVFFTSQGAIWCLGVSNRCSQLITCFHLDLCCHAGKWVLLLLTMRAIAWEEGLVPSWRYSDLSSCSGSHSGKMKEMLCVYLAFTLRCKRGMRSNTLSCGLPLLLVHHVWWICRHFP